MFVVTSLDASRYRRTDDNFVAVLNGLYLAVTSNDAILIWPLDALTCNPNKLQAHSKCIQGITFGVGVDDEHVLLCSSDSSQIIVWTIGIGGFSHDCVSIAHDYGCHESIKLCPRDNFLAVVAQNVVHVMSVNEDSRGNKIASLECHSSAIIMAEFSFFTLDLLVTCSADKTYSAWNYRTNELLYQSAINVLGMYTCVAMDPNSDRYAVATSNGQITIVTPPNFSSPQSLDLSRSPFRKKSISDTPRNINSSLSGDLISLFFSMKPTMPKQKAFAYQSRPDNLNSQSDKAFSDERKSPTNELLDWPPLLVVGFTAGVILIHALTFEKLFQIEFDQTDIRNFEKPRQKTQISSAFNFSFMDIEDSLQLWCLITEEDKPFTKVHLLIMNHPFATQQVQNENASSDEEFGDLSVVATNPIVYNSPLRLRLARRPTIMAARAKLSKPPFKTVNSKSAITGASAIANDQPVTFKEKIKSSGYGNHEPPRKLFTPKTNMKSSSTKPKEKAKGATGADSLIESRQYPADADPPLTEKASIDADATVKKQITHLRFSPNGKMLAAASVNKIVHVFNMPLAGKGSALNGHNAPVKSVNWSLDSSRLVTASDDKTVRIWNSFGDLDQCLKIDSMGSSQKPGRSFEKEISWSSFYYNDSLVLLTSGKTLFAYTYDIDLTKTSDIKTYDNKCRYAKVLQVEFADCASITSASAVNSFLSHFVFIATSAKSLYIYDMNRCKIVRTLESCHERPVHCIKHNEGSLYSRLYSATSQSWSSENYNLFATSAACDGIKVWDVRQRLCVRKFDNHYNKFYNCGFDWSPCGKYIATSSEDRSAYLYDVAASACIHKYTKLSDIGTSVSFHPLFPEVAFSFNDGKIRLFSARENTSKNSNLKRGGMKSATVVTTIGQIRKQSTGGSGGGKVGAIRESFTPLQEQRSSAVKELL